MLLNEPDQWVSRAPVKALGFLVEDLPLVRYKAAKERKVAFAGVYGFFPVMLSIVYDAAVCLIERAPSSGRWPAAGRERRLKA